MDLQFCYSAEPHTWWQLNIMLHRNSCKSMCWLLVLKKNALKWLKYCTNGILTLSCIDSGHCWRISSCLGRILCGLSGGVLLDLLNFGWLNGGSCLGLCISDSSLGRGRGSIITWIRSCSSTSLLIVSFGRIVCGLRWTSVPVIISRLCSCGCKRGEIG